MGLIGAGVFAGYHAGKLADHPRVSFVGLYDPDTDRAAALAEKYGVMAMDADAVFEQCQAVVIACPASFHGAMALDALHSDCHLLIEKPIATRLREADAIVALAQDKNRIVQIGHQERIVMRAIGLDRVSETPIRVEAVRANGYSPRGTDTSVTLDLMTHDIDLCTMAFDQAPDRVEGQSEAVKSETPDRAEARLSYGDAVAHLRASRVSESPERRMVITYPSGTVEIDFNAKTLRHDTPFDLNADFGASPLAKDSLGAATDVFIRAVLDGDPVSVSAEAGRIAMRVACKIDGVIE